MLNLFNSILFRREEIRANETGFEVISEIVHDTANATQR